jgi:hypothetical protein
MSYTHLAGRLIEIQRSLVGPPAVDIAQSTDGLAVTDDGTVTDIDGNPTAVVDELVAQYSEKFGDVTVDRFRSAATEFEDELDLPPPLQDGGAATDAGDPDASTDSPVDGEKASPREDDDTQPAPTASGSTSTDTSEEPVPEADVNGTGARTDSVTVGPVPEQADHAEEASSRDPVTLEFSADGTTVDEDDADPASVYLMAETDRDWQVPISVADAIAQPVARASNLDRDEIAVADYVDPEQVLSALLSDESTPLSFEVEDLAVEFHPDGSVRVH